MMKKLLILIFLAGLILTSCSSKEDKIFEDALDKLENRSEQPISSEDADNPSETATSEVSVRTLTILTGAYDDSGTLGENNLLYWYAKAFMKTHPDVKIVFDVFNYKSLSKNNSQVVIKLTADSPPDIVNLYELATEKYVPEALFCDLNEYIDGDSGTDRSLYFDNILSGTQTNNGLYSLPLTFTGSSHSIRKSSAEEIGVDVKEYESQAGIDSAYKVDAYARLNELKPDSGSLLMFGFYAGSIFEYEWHSILDFANKTVNVDNPEIKKIIEEASVLPTDRDITPEAAYLTMHFSKIHKNWNENSDPEFFYADSNYLFFYTGFNPRFVYRSCPTTVKRLQTTNQTLRC